MDSITKGNGRPINRGLWGEARLHGVVSLRVRGRCNVRNFGCVLEKNRGRCYNVESKAVKNDEKSN